MSKIINANVLIFLDYVKDFLYFKCSEMICHEEEICKILQVHNTKYISFPINPLTFSQIKDI
jgi:hypothetical protein